MKNLGSILTGLRLMVKELLCLDLRSLAFFRVLLGGLILFDLAERAVDFRSHYTDFGVLTRQELLTGFPTEWVFQFHIMSGGVVFQAILFLIAAFSGLSVLFGFYTRLGCFLSWVFLVSLQERNPMILHGGDQLLRLISFWAMFLPLGRVFSFDQFRKKSSTETASWNYFSMACAGLTLQILSVYVFSGILKNHPDWTVDGTAVYYALNIDQFVTSTGKRLLAFPETMKFLSFSTLYIEIFAPFLLFVPFKNQFFKFFTVLLFWGFHLGLGATLRLGIFPFISAAAWSVFIPSFIWDSLRRTPMHKWLNPFLQPDRKGEAKITQPAKRFLNARRSISFALFLTIILNLAWNLRSVAPGKVNIPMALERVVLALRLDQHWNMFAPHPLKEDGWYVIPGRFEGGEIKDLMTGEAVDWYKPELVSERYKNVRWQKYMMNIWSRNYTRQREGFAQYLCRVSNDDTSNEKRLEFLEIFFMLEVSLPDGAQSRPEKVLLWNQVCPSGKL